MNLTAWLVGMVGPLMARWLASAGLTFVSLVGLTAAATALKNLVIADIGGLPLVAVQLGGLFGLWDVFGIVFGTITFCLTWASTSGFWKLAKV